MDNKEIVLTLNVDEFLILQEAMTDYGNDTGLYQWMCDLKQQVLLKMNQAYVKPTISKDDYIQKLREEKVLWQNSGNNMQLMMVSAEANRLRFYNNIKGNFSYFDYYNKQEIFPEGEFSDATVLDKGGSFLNETVLEQNNNELEMNASCGMTDDMEMGD